MRLILNLVALGLLAGAVGWGWHEARQPGRMPLREIRFQGLVHTDADKALEVVAIPKETNLLRIRPDDVRERMLEHLPWLRDVDVRRLYPDALAITVMEKTPVCMGRDRDGRVMLMDEYGTPIKPLEAGDPLQPPLVTPHGSRDDEGARVVALVNLLGRHPWLKPRISDANGLPGGRWVLNTREGVRLLLPPEGDAALEVLKQLQEKYQLLDRRIRQVDLRISGKAAVRPLI